MMRWHADVWSTEPARVIKTLSPAGYGILSSRAERGIATPVDDKPVFVYILASRTRRLYVGVTNNLVRRVWEHREDSISGFTKRYGIKSLVYFERIDNPLGAIQREKQIKGYARVKKFALIDSLNPEWHDLADHWFADVNRPDPSLRSG